MSTCWLDQAALSLTFQHRRLTVMAGEDTPSTPLFLWVKGMDADLRRRDGRGQPKDQRQARLVLDHIHDYKVTFIGRVKEWLSEHYGKVFS
jgi:hypothetical protein